MAQIEARLTTSAARAPRPSSTREEGEPTPCPRPSRPFILASAASFCRLAITMSPSGPFNEFVGHCPVGLSQLPNFPRFFLKSIVKSKCHTFRRRSVPPLCRGYRWPPGLARDPDEELPRRVVDAVDDMVVKKRMFGWTGGRLASGRWNAPRSVCAAKNTVRLRRGQ